MSPRSFVVACCMLMGIGSHAQNLALQGGVGYGSYLMSDVRDVQDAFDGGVPVPIKRTDNLGPSPYVDMQFRIYTKRDFFAGFVYRHMSSGVRSVYSDYSGTVEFRQKVDANCFGIMVAAKLRVHTKIQFSTGLEMYAVNESYEAYLYEAYTGQASNTQTSNATNQSFQANVFLEALYPLGDWSVGMKAAYTADPLSKDLKLDWTGWRAGLYATYNFSSQ